MKTKKTLYFIDGSHPSKEQWAKGQELGASFRNARLIGQSDKAEPCDAVCGCIPKQYEGIAKIDTSEIDGSEAVKASVAKSDDIEKAEAEAKAKEKSEAETKAQAKAEPAKAGKNK